MAATQVQSVIANVSQSYCLDSFTASYKPQNPFFFFLFEGIVNVLIFVNSTTEHTQHKYIIFYNQKKKKKEKMLESVKNKKFSILNNDL